MVIIIKSIITTSCVGVGIYSILFCWVVLQLSSCPASLMKSCSLIGCSPASRPRPCWVGTGNGVRWVPWQADSVEETKNNEELEWILFFCLRFCLPAENRRGAAADVLLKLLNSGQVLGCTGFICPMWYQKLLFVKKSSVFICLL